LTLVIKLKIIIKDLFTDLRNYKIVIVPEYALEAETKTPIKLELVIGIETPLDTMFITLQNEREKN